MANLYKTEEEIFEEVASHLEFSIEHEGFTIGENTAGGCSCSICEYLRGVLILRFYTKNGYMPKMPPRERK